jgi:hypothetical protein
MIFYYVLKLRECNGLGVYEGNDIIRKVLTETIHK